MAPNAAASLDISLYNKPSLTLHCRLAVCTPKSSLCLKISMINEMRPLSRLDKRPLRRSCIGRYIWKSWTMIAYGF